MMLSWIHKARGLSNQFFDADLGGKSGSPNSGEKGGSPNGETVDVEKLFAGIPFDELDPKTRETLNNVKKSVATLQSTAVKTEGELENIKKQARDFQSQKDQLDAKLKQLTNGAPPTKDDYLEAAKKVLKEQGYTEEQIGQQAPVFARLFKESIGTFKTELGRDLTPLANTVSLNDAKSAFESAQQEDSLGILGVPEVAQKVWEQIRENASKGQPTSPAFVLNLAKIVYMDYSSEQKQNGKPMPELVPSMVAPPAGASTGGFNFPGANRMAARPLGSPPRDPKAPKTVLNDDTQAALAMTFKDMGRDSGVYPEGFQPKAKK